VVAFGAAVTGADQVASAMLQLAKENDAKVYAVVKHYGALLRTQVMRNASGRPGPNVVTGDYRRSITLRVGSGGSNFSAAVGTNNPQGRRLEFGFHGTDSRGRTYAQPPYPHFGPAFSFLSPQFLEALRRIV